MTPYDKTFLPFALAGLGFALIASILAGRTSGCLWPFVFLIPGIGVLWACLFLGTAYGYDAWQRMPDPPDEAFSDASVVGALVFGWMPAGLYCAVILVLTRGFRSLLGWANPNAAVQQPPESSKFEAPQETGNPYQGPGTN